MNSSNLARSPSCNGLAFLFRRVASTSLFTVAIRTLVERSSRGCRQVLKAKQNLREIAGAKGQIYAPAHLAQVVENRKNVFSAGQIPQRKRCVTWEFRGWDGRKNEGSEQVNRDTSIEDGVSLVVLSSGCIF